MYKLLESQNVNSRQDIYGLEQDRIDTMIELLPQLSVNYQLKRPLYHSSDRVIMDETINNASNIARMANRSTKRLQQSTIFCVDVFFQYLRFCESVIFFFFANEI